MIEYQQTSPSFALRWAVRLELNPGEIITYLLLYMYTQAMKRLRTFIPLLIAVPLLFTNAPTAQASCNTYANSLGGQSGTCDGVRVNTYGNSLGGVSGTIGDKRINTYGNSLGGVSGTIGDQRINTYGNSLGGVSGTIGNSRINTYGNSLGGVSGTIGNSRINTYGNSLGGVSGTGIGGVPGITSSNKNCFSSFTKKC